MFIKIIKKFKTLVWRLLNNVQDVTKLAENEQQNCRRGYHAEKGLPVFSAMITVMWGADTFTS
jgi:hypothetical protein